MTQQSHSYSLFLPQQRVIVDYCLEQLNFSQVKFYPFWQQCMFSLWFLLLIKLFLPAFFWGCVIILDSITDLVFFFQQDQFFYFNVLLNTMAFHGMLYFICLCSCKLWKVYHILLKNNTSNLEGQNSYSPFCHQLWNEK